MEQKDLTTIEMTDLIKIIDQQYNQWIRNTVSMKMWEDKTGKRISTRSFSRLPEFARNKRNPEIPTKERAIHKNKLGPFKYTFQGSIASEEAPPFGLTSAQSIFPSAIFTPSHTRQTIYRVKVQTFQRHNPVNPWKLFLINATFLAIMKPSIVTERRHVNELKFILYPNRADSVIGMWV